MNRRPILTVAATACLLIGASSSAHAVQPDPDWEAKYAALVVRAYAATPDAATTAPPNDRPAAPAKPSAAVAAGLNQSFTDSAGTKSTYHLWNVPSPKGIVAVFDGDGQSGFDSPDSNHMFGGDGGIVAAAARHGMATLAIRTPGADGTWYGDGARNADYAAELIAKMKTDLGTDVVWAFGYSGGSNGITGFLAPAHPETFAKGGFVVTGGGGKWGGKIPTFPAGVKLHWHTGGGDTGDKASDGYDAISSAKEGAAAYAAAGNTVTTSWPAGETHDLSGKFGSILDGQLK